MWRLEKVGGPKMVARGGQLWKRVLWEAEAHRGL